MTAPTIMTFERCGKVLVRIGFENGEYVVSAEGYLEERFEDRAEAMEFARGLASEISNKGIPAPVAPAPQQPKAAAVYEELRRIEERRARP